MQRPRLHRVGRVGLGLIGTIGSGRREAKREMGDSEGVGWRDVVANRSPLFEHTILYTSGDV